MKSSTSQSQSPSYIPLLSPKSARKPGPTLITSSLPSSLSAPHLGLVPPKRTPSGSSPSLPQQSLQQQQQQQAAVHPPQLPHPPSSPQASGGGGTSLPSLRALRSFLPFGGGSGKSAFASNAAVPGSLKSPFAGFASGRRTSITVERKNSGQFSRPGGDDIIDVAVIAISPPTSSKANTEHTRDITHSADAQAQSLPSASASHAELAPPVVTFNPGPPLSTELSTILESDLSGLSKHLPALDESRSSDVSGSGHSNKPEAPPPSPQINELVALDASVLDLSTSQLKEEVMHALKEKTSRNGWLSGVVVEDVPDSRPPSREMLEANAAEEPEESFHLDALDPDLVALLSANRIRAKQPIFQTEIPFASTLTPQQPQPIVPPRIFPPSRAVTPQSRPSPLGHSPVDVSPSSATGSARSQPSPVRANAPHAHPSLARSAPTRFVPRLMRSVTDRAVSTRGDRNVENAARAPSDSALPLDDARRISSDSLYLRRPPVSPLHLPLEFQPPPPPIQHTNTEPLRRVAPSRLATPARFGMNGSATSRLLRSALPSSSTLPSAWGGDSPSPTSRASSAIGTAADRLIRPRTSEDGALEGRPSARELLGYAPRNRNRSFSVGGGNTERATSPAPRPTEWLGPRTAKAFAAAGLLDRDANGGASRFGSVRSLGDRDQRPLAPSRLAASEAGSAASSWQSGSVSRAMTHSEATGHDSASTSTGAPRTTRSADSTAPTSISMSRPQSRTPSPQHKNYQAVLQAMVEKHATETGTLLAALADAQHNAQSLRAENGRLKERVEDLEAELVDARVQLRTHQCAGGSAVAPPHSSAHLQPPARAVLGWTEREASADAALVTSRRRPMPTLPLSASGPGGSRVVVDLKRMRDADDENATYQGGRFAPSRRASGGADSVFAVPPPNMSMLLQEQPAGSRRSGSSCVSMTTVSAPTDVDAPGSPRSLFLRPEHESHLGDLGSLDMRFTEDEGDDDAAGFDME
ncbi:hypothetical protein F5148DRAFT_981594 [Russula earlei]|uniref:Uncharacterized protein n=1 Tax=Russula earlei TaxID=71964 RepID=A0ACC0U7R9_9AGAM|nr:hypothetical protein F5148DRAFT_981594 [Russula earlei]